MSAGRLSVTAYMHGVNSTRSFTVSTEKRSMKRFREQMTAELEIVPLFGIRQPWAIFTSDAQVRCLRLDLEKVTGLTSSEFRN